MGIDAQIGRLDSLGFLDRYDKYLGGNGLPQLEIDMLAIDMIAPFVTNVDGGNGDRIKLYFRSRRTSFASVREMLTLGGQLKGYIDFAAGLE